MNDQVAAQLEALTGLMASLQKTVNDLNGSIDRLSGSTQNMTRNMANAEKSVDGFNRLLSQNRSSTEELDESLKKSLESIEKYSTSTAEKVQKATINIKSKYGMFFRDSEAQMLKHNKGFLRQFRNYAEEQAEIYSNLESRRLRFFHGFDMFKDHLKFFSNIGTKIFKIFTNLLGTLINIGKFLVTMPLKTLESILEIAHSVREEFLAITQTLENTQEFFSGQSIQGEGFKRLTAEVRGLGTTFLNVGSVHARVFGYGLQGQQAMIDRTREKIVALSTLSNLYGASYERNALMVEQSMQILGMSVEDNMFLVRQSMSEGIHPFEAMNRAIHASRNAMEEFGIDQKQVARGMNVLRKNVIEFSHLSQQEFADITAQAAQLGVEAEGLVSIFNKFTTFDTAAESAALLSQTFGMAVDAMSIIRAEDPLEILNQFRDGMMQTGRDFKDLSRHEKALLSQYTGLNGEMLQTAMSFEGIGLSYEELQQKMEENSPQAQLQRTVREMADSIKEFANVGKQLTSPFQAMSEGMKDAIVKNTRFQRSLMGLSNSMQRIYTSVMSAFLTDDLMGAIEGVINAFGRLIDGTVAREFANLAQKVGAFLTVMLDASSSSEKVSAAFDNMLNTFTNSVFVERLIEIGKKMIGSIVRGFILALPTLMEGFLNLLKAFNSVFNPQSAARQQLSGWFKDYIGTALDSAAKGGGTVRDAIGRLASHLGSELTAAMGNSTSFMAQSMMKLGGYFFDGIIAAFSNLNGGLGVALATLLIPPFISTAGTLMLGKSLLRGSLSGLGSASALGITGAEVAGASLGLGGTAASLLPFSSSRAMSKAVSAEELRASRTQAPVPTTRPDRSPTFQGQNVTDRIDETARRRRGGLMNRANRFARGAGGGLIGGALGIANATSAISNASEAPWYRTVLSGAGAVAGLAAPFLGPLAGVALAASGAIAAFDHFVPAVESATEASENSAQEMDRNRSQYQSETDSISQSSQSIVEAINRLGQRPVEINLSINQSIDGQDLTNRVISAMLQGTTQYIVSSDQNDYIKIKHRGGQGNIDPTPATS